MAGYSQLPTQTEGWQRRFPLPLQESIYAEMRYLRFLRNYNQTALAILLSWGLIMAAVISIYTWRANGDSDQRDGFHLSEESPVQGEEIETQQGIVTVYKAKVPEDDEAVRDVRYVAMKTGEIGRVADDPKAWVYGEKAVGNLGRAALVKTGMRGNRLVFDFVFVRFPKLERFTIARTVDALDSTEQLDDGTFSAVVWDEIGRARFIVVDANTGDITTTRQLDFSRSGRTAVEDAATEAAPASSFR